MKDECQPTHGGVSGVKDYSQSWHPLIVTRLAYYCRITNRLSQMNSSSSHWVSGCKRVSCAAYVALTCHPTMLMEVAACPQMDIHQNSAPISTFCFWWPAYLQWHGGITIELKLRPHQTPRRAALCREMKAGKSLSFMAPHFAEFRCYAWYCRTSHHSAARIWWGVA